MTGRPRGARAAVIALGLTAGGVAAVQANAVIFPKPVVSVSTLTVPNRDYLAVVVTAFPKCVRVTGRSVCPDSLDFRGRLQIGKDEWTELEGSRSRSRNGAKDTLLVSKPVCPEVGRVTGYVAAEQRGAVERSDRGAASVAVPCRVLRAAEREAARAIEDTFPKADQAIVLASWWGQKMPAAEREIAELEDVRAAKTAADTAKARAKWADVRTGPDSLYRPPVGDTLVVHVGYGYQFCWLGRNRFTSQVEVLDGDPSRCEAARAAFQSRRSG